MTRCIHRHAPHALQWAGSSGMGSQPNLNAGVAQFGGREARDRGKPTSSPFIDADFGAV